MFKAFDSSQIGQVNLDRPMRWQLSRQRVQGYWIWLAAFLVCSVFAYSTWQDRDRIGHLLHTSFDDSSAIRRRALVHDGPTATFGKNLLPNTSYLTCSMHCGISNQFIAVSALLLLADRLDRIPILPDFEPIHVPNANFIPVSTFFDLGPLASRQRRPILNWAQVKRPKAEAHAATEEHIPCWAINYPLGGWKLTHVERYNLRLDYEDPSYPLQYLENNIIAVNDVIRLEQSPKQQRQLACFDHPYYVRQPQFNNGKMTLEPLESMTPNQNLLWDEIARYIPFQQSLVEKAYRVLRRVDSRLRPHAYMAVHMRRGDFVTGGDTVADAGQAYAAYFEAVNKMQAVHRRPLPVIVTTDSDEPGLLAATDAAGWFRVDHDKLNTAIDLGPWYPSLVDMVLLSSAKAFVGTRSSTMSSLAAARVIDWHQGTAILV